jgi:hypothetical protein
MDPSYSHEDLDVIPPERLQRIHDFSLFVSRAHNVEDFRLCLGPQMDWPHRRPARDYLFRDIFYPIAKRSSLSGQTLELPFEGKLLPKVKSLEPGYHPIDFNLLLDFVRQRKETLKRVVLNQVTDNGKEQTGGPSAIREAVGAGPDDGFFVGWHNCYVRF